MKTDLLNYVLSSHKIHTKKYNQRNKFKFSKQPHQISFFMNLLIALNSSSFKGTMNS